MVLRILDIKDDQYLVVDCRKIRMPKWINIDEVSGFEKIEEVDLIKLFNIDIPKYDDLDNIDKKITNERFGSISIIVNSVGDFSKEMNY